jgi:hypothetical protein
MAQQTGSLKRSRVLNELSVEKFFEAARPDANALTILTPIGGIQRTDTPAEGSRSFTIA